MTNSPFDALETPVALIIFNRPDYTQQVFDQLRQIRPLKMLVVADGPRAEHPEDLNKCAATRRIIDQIDWPCDLVTNYADQNLGCGKRISSGLNWVFGQVEEAIILEDDCVPELDFFPFCEAMLHRYRDDERIMMISGSNMVDDFDIPESYFFSRWYNIWGWATWRRAWQPYDFTIADWPVVRETHLLEAAYPKKYIGRYLRRNLDLVHTHRIDTWDIQWFFTCLRSHGLSIVPRVNLIANIGVFGTHTQGGHGGILSTGKLNTKHLQHPNWVHAHPTYDNAFFDARLKPRLRTLINRYAVAIRLRIRRLSAK